MKKIDVTSLTRQLSHNDPAYPLYFEQMGSDIILRATTFAGTLYPLFINIQITSQGIEQAKKEIRDSVKRANHLDILDNHVYYMQLQKNVEQVLDNIK